MPLLKLPYSESSWLVRDPDWLTFCHNEGTYERQHFSGVFFMLLMTELSGRSWQYFLKIFFWSGLLIYFSQAVILFLLCLARNTSKAGQRWNWLLLLWGGYWLLSFLEGISLMWPYLALRLITQGLHATSDQPSSLYSRHFTPPPLIPHWVFF